MPTNPTTYEFSDGVATITMDDGKANVMSLAMLDSLLHSLDQAESDGAVVLLTGRPGIFSGGYDLAMFKESADVIEQALRAGGDVVQRMLSFPLPVVIACNGHAVAQGAFTLFGADVRFGSVGDFKVGLNEVAIGLTIPWYGIEAARLRLTPAGFSQATTTGSIFSPTEAHRVGFFDELVEPDALHGAARAEAERLTGIDMTAHAAIKLRVRGEALAQIRVLHDAEFPAG